MAQLDDTIVSTGPVDPIVSSLLEPFGSLVLAKDHTEASILAVMDRAVGLVVRGEARITAQIIQQAPRLKVIGRTGVGYNNVDIGAATERNIPVVFTPGAGARAVAEAAVCWMLTLCKRVMFWDQQLKAGNWQSRFQFNVGDLEGATLGIVGFGRIGQQLAQLVRPFDMTVVAYDPFVDPTLAEEHGVALVSLETLVAQADFVSLHAAASAENHGLINRRILAKVKPGAYLLNLARGELIESLDVLLEALQDGRLAGVGLDTFAPEPPDIQHPIFQHPDCLTAPHAMAGSKAAMSRIFRWMSQDMAAVLSGKRPQHVVNPETCRDLRS